MNFIFELNQLKRVRHEGWKLIGINDPESVAEHSLRSAQIGYILAKMEKYGDPNEVCTMIVFHDMQECRIGDLHRVANRYVKVDDAKVVKAQTEGLEDMGRDIFNLWRSAEDRSTKAGIIAKDADRLDMAFTAKEYIEHGFDHAKDWMGNIAISLRTDSAKKLFEDLKNSDSSAWWQGLKKLKG